MNNQSRQLPNWFDHTIGVYLGIHRDAVLQQLSNQSYLPSWINQPNPPEWLERFLASFGRGGIMEPHRWMLELWVKEHFITQDDPSWFSDMERTFSARIAHQFILHFNVRDYIFDARYGYRDLESYLLNVYPPKDRHFLIYNLSQGLVDGYTRIDEKGNNPRWSNFLNRIQTFISQQNATRFIPDPDVALQAMELQLRETTDSAPDHDLVNAVALFNFAEKVVPAIDFAQQDQTVRRLIETLQRWSIDRKIHAQHNLILLVTQNLADVANELRTANSQTQTVEIPMPSTADRLKYISATFYQYVVNHNITIRFSSEKEDFPIDDSSDEPALLQQMRAFAKLSSGLNRVGIRDVILRSIRDGVPIKSDLLQQRKEVLILSESRGMLQSIKTRSGLDAIGGMKPIKDYLRDEVIRLLKSGDPAMEQNTPSGVLFVGPPGTGKTIVAEALSQESGVSLVKLGNIRASYVGESERNLALALNIIRSMSPVIVFMDELDQSEGRRGEQNLDSGVSSRIFGQLLEFIGDQKNRGRVVWLAASNRPDLIDDAMTRPGRFDRKIPFLVPNQSERADIFRVNLIKKHNISTENVELIDLNYLSHLSEGYTGAEIETIVNRGMTIALLGEMNTQSKGDREIIQTKHLEEAIKRFIVGERSLRYRLMSLLALQSLDDTRFIPDVVRGEYFDNNGKPLQKLSDEISELRQKIG